MRYTGNYDSIECDYDLDHEINKEVERVKWQIEVINDNGESENRKAILKAIANEIIEAI